MVGVKFKISILEEDDYDEEIPEEEEDFEDFENSDNEDDNFEEDNKTEKAPQKYIFSCIGIGLKNVSRIEA